MSFLRPLESVLGVLELLPGKLMCGQVVSFPVGHGSGAVCMFSN
jgi:hypothetical protein